MGIRAQKATGQVPAWHGMDGVLHTRRNESDVNDSMNID